MQLSGNSDSIFITPGDTTAGRAVRFDGDTDEHVDNYELGEDDARAFAVDDDHLYVNENYFGDLVEIDIQTGETQRTLPVSGPEMVAVDGLTPSGFDLTETGISSAGPGRRAGYDCGGSVFGRWTGWSTVLALMNSYSAAPRSAPPPRSEAPPLPRDPSNHSRASCANW